MSRLVGSNLADDAFAGLWQNDTLYGLGGNDFVYGGDGNDLAHGGTGNDVILGEAGDDRLWGDAGNDQIYDFEGANVMAGGRGDDYLGGQGHLLGQDGNDYLDYEGNYGLYDTTMEGGQGSDLFTVGMYVWSMAEPNQRIAITDFRPDQGEHLQLHVHDPLGNDVADQMQIFNLFDSNHDNTLTGDDIYVDPDANGDGLDIHFWNATLDVQHVQQLTSDFLL